MAKTNIAPTKPYRGAGIPQGIGMFYASKKSFFLTHEIATVASEWLVDHVARCDKNLNPEAINSSPDSFSFSYQETWHCPPYIPRDQLLQRCALLPFFCVRVCGICLTPYDLQGDLSSFSQVMENVSVGHTWFECRQNFNYDQKRKDVDAFNATHHFKKRGLAIAPVRYRLITSSLYMPFASTSAHLAE